MRWAWIAWLGVVSAPAAADVSREQAETATALFAQGQRELEAGKIDAACSSFAASLANDPQVGTRLNLAACREKQGRNAEAYALYEDATIDATLEKKQGRETFARDRMAALLAQLVRVTVRVSRPPQGVIVLAGARPIDSTKLQLFDPGVIAIDVTAPGRKPFHQEVAGRAGGELVIDVPELELAPPPPVATPQPPAESPREPARYTIKHTSRLPLVLVAGGTLAALGGAGLGYHAKLRYDDAVDARDSPGLDSAMREADIATGVAVVGVAALAVGVVLYARGHGVVVDRVVAAPTVGRDLVGLTVIRPF